MERAGDGARGKRRVDLTLTREGGGGLRDRIEMLSSVLELAMALCDCRSVAEVTSRQVQTEGYRIRALL